MNISKTTLLLCALIMSIGWFGGGYSIGKGIYLIKKLSRTVTVKGLAEQDVKSDLGIWEINYREVGNNLVQIDSQVQHDQQVVTEFLKQQGFAENEINATQFKVEDRLANIYSQTTTQNNNQPRYVVTAGVRVRSEKVESIDKSSQVIDKLLQQGVPLTFDASSISPNPSYYYMGLDKIRPAMLAEATKSAYIVAQQFAKDSGSRLGSIARANQGVFQIMGRDSSTMSADWNSNQSALGSIDKKVRLVTTIDYQLR